MHPRVRLPRRGGSSPRLVGVLKIALLPAAATTVVYSPQLLTDSDQISRVPPPLILLWVVLLLSTAPAVAWGLSRRGVRLKASGEYAFVGLTQVGIALILVRLDTWLEVRSGYLLAGSGEEAMSYGIGTVVGGVAGILIALLVVSGAKLGQNKTAGPISSALRSR